MRWDPRVRYAHTVDILSTCTTTSTSLPTPQVESSLSSSLAMVYQQVTMVHLARYMPVWAWHISSKLHVRFIDHKLSIYSRPLTGIMTSFPTLDGNQISSDEQEQQQQQQQQDSDTYIGRAFGSTYYNKGGGSFLTYHIHIVWSAVCSNPSQHTKDG